MSHHEPTALAFDRDPTDLGVSRIPSTPVPPPVPRVRVCEHGTPGRRAVDGTPVCPRCWAIENGQREPRPGHRTATTHHDQEATHA